MIDDPLARPRPPAAPAPFKSARHAKLGLTYPSEAASDGRDAPPRFDAEGRSQLRWLQGALVLIVVLLFTPLVLAALT